MQHLRIDFFFLLYLQIAPRDAIRPGSDVSIFFLLSKSRRDSLNSVYFCFYLFRGVTMWGVRGWLGDAFRLQIMGVLK